MDRLFSLFLEEVRCCGKVRKQRRSEGSKTSCYDTIITRNRAPKRGGEGADEQQFWCHPTEARHNKLSINRREREIQNLRIGPNVIRRLLCAPLLK